MMDPPSDHVIVTLEEHVARALKLVHYSQPGASYVLAFMDERAASALRLSSFRRVPPQQTEFAPAFAPNAAGAVWHPQLQAQQPQVQQPPAAAAAAPATPATTRRADESGAAPARSSPKKASGTWADRAAWSPAEDSAVVEVARSAPSAEQARTQEHQCYRAMVQVPRDNWDLMTQLDDSTISITVDGKRVHVRMQVLHYDGQQDYDYEVCMWGTGAIDMELQEDVFKELRRWLVKEDVHERWHKGMGTKQPARQRVYMWLG